ncbi:MAG: succinate dehydrogenase, cytochrome b556 subunit [Pseudomonadota bacterium]
MTDSNRPPLSPHLQVYRLPLTALISITHRATGAVLSAGALLFVILLAAAASGANSYNAIHSHLSSWYGTIFLMGYTFALFFHMCNGIRHLFWDIGWGFDLATADLTAKLVIAGAAALTAIAWAIALGV